MKRFLKTILRKPFVINFLARIGALYLKFCYHTTRWHYEGFELVDEAIQNKHPIVIVFWHGRMTMLPPAWRWKQTSFSMLLSAHRDGQLIGAVLSHFGIRTIVGSSTRGGTQAYLEMIEQNKNGVAIGITPDGPKGPAGFVAPGAAALAHASGAHMFAVSFAKTRCKKLNTWDSFVVPKPFGRGVFVVQKVDLSGDDRDMHSACIAETLNNVTQKSDDRILS